MFDVGQDSTFPSFPLHSPHPANTGPDQHQQEGDGDSRQTKVNGRKGWKTVTPSSDNAEGRDGSTCQFGEVCLEMIDCHNTCTFYDRVTFGRRNPSGQH